MRKKSILIIFLITTLIFTENLSYKVDKIKLDYSNLEFNLNGREFNANLYLKKLLLSTSNSAFYFNERSENIILNIGPSKLTIQGLNFDLFNNYSGQNLTFNIGTLNFDIIECDFDVLRGDEPQINVFNAKFNMNNIDLNLMNFGLPPDVERFFNKKGVQINRFTINRATANIAYDQFNKLKIDINGATNFGNLKIKVLGTIDERYPDRSNFQTLSVQISNLSRELQSIIRSYELETGQRIPIENGMIKLDLKNQLNPNNRYDRGTDLDYFK